MYLPVLDRSSPSVEELTTASESPSKSSSCVLLRPMTYVVNVDVHLDFVPLFIAATFSSYNCLFCVRLSPRIPNRVDPIRDSRIMGPTGFLGHCFHCQPGDSTFVYFLALL